MGHAMAVSRFARRDWKSLTNLANLIIETALNTDALKYAESLDWKG